MLKLFRLLTQHLPLPCRIPRNLFPFIEAKKIPLSTCVIQCTYILQRHFKAFSICNFHKLKSNRSLKALTILREKQNYYIYTLLWYFTRKGVQPVIIVIYWDHIAEKMEVFIVLLLKLEKCARYHIISAWRWLIAIHHHSKSFKWKVPKTYLQPPLPKGGVYKYHRKSCVCEVITSKYAISNDIGWYEILPVVVCIWFWENILHMFP